MVGRWNKYSRKEINFRRNQKREILNLAWKISEILDISESSLYFTKHFFSSKFFQKTSKRIFEENQIFL